MIQPTRQVQAASAVKNQGQGVLQRCACGGAAGPSGECAACKKKREAKEGRAQGNLVQRETSGPGVRAEVPASVYGVLRSTGQPLDPQIRAEMEPRFGHDFSRVRVHTDGPAAQSARDVRAHAYTVGQHVVFGEGRYQPRVRAGRSLLAHELTHTIQQGSQGPDVQVQRLSIAAENSPLESEAVQAAGAVLSGKNTKVALHIPSQIQRAPWAGGVCPPGEQVPANNPLLYGGAELVMVEYYRRARKPGAVNEFITNFDALEQMPTTGTQGPMVGAMQKHFRSGKNPSWRRKGQTTGDADKTPAPAPQQGAGGESGNPMPSTDPKDLVGGLVLDDAEFELLRPDILDVKRREVYDVTTKGLASAKVSKIQGYVKLLETIRTTEGIAGPAWSAGTTLPEPSRLIVHYPLMPGVTLCFASTDLTARAGVLSYEVLRLKKDEEGEKDRIKVPVPLPVPQTTPQPVPLPIPKGGPVPVPKPDVQPSVKPVPRPDQPVPVPDGEGGKVIPFKPKPKPDGEAAPAPDSEVLPIAAAVALATATVWALSRRWGEKAVGAAAGKALVYAQMAAAAVLIVFYADRAEAKPGPGESPLEALFKAMAQNGTPIPPELKKAIEADPKLKKLLEDAAKNHDVSGPQSELSKQMMQEINNHLDEFSQEDLELLLQASEGQTTPQAVPTVEAIKKAIEAKKKGANGSGPGGSGTGTAQNPLPETQQKDASGNTQPNNSAPPTTPPPSPADRLVAGLSSPDADGLKTTDALRIRLRSVAAAATPPLTDTEVTTLLGNLGSAKGKTEDEIVAAVKQGIQNLRQNKGQPGGAEGEGKPVKDAGQNQGGAASPTPSPQGKTISQEEFIKQMIQRIKNYKGWGGMSNNVASYLPKKGQSFLMAPIGSTVQATFYVQRASKGGLGRIRSTADLTLRVKSRAGTAPGSAVVCEVVGPSLLVDENGKTEPFPVKEIQATVSP